MKNKSNKVFVSVFSSKKTLDQNNRNTDKALELLHRDGVSPQLVNGVYKGEMETTFLLSSDSAEGHEENLGLARNLGALFNQESILEVHNDDTAILHYLSGAVSDNLGALFNQESILEVHNDDTAILHYLSGAVSDNLGTFTEVTQDEALQSNSHTHDPVSGRYFIVK